MHTLRARLVLSHLLPMLVILPIMGIALVYVLETQLLLPDISSELSAQGVLLAQLAAEKPSIWTQPAQARSFITRFGALVTARMMLINPQGELIASSDPLDQGNEGQFVGIYQPEKVLEGESSARTSYSQALLAEVADVYVPVPGVGNQVQGIIRLTHRLTSVYTRFLRLRTLIFSILAAGLVLGALTGLGLALNLQRPLQQVTVAVGQLTRGERLDPLPVQGPDEIRNLSEAVNILVERLHSLETSRKQLLANLVHELGRPLGALRSAIQALLGGADQDPALRGELLEGMDEEAARLQRLLEDLAHLHEQILGTLELQRRPLQLAEWLPLFLSPWREEARLKRLKWETAVPAGLPVIRVDPDRLGQAIGNLLSNAIKYTSPAGTISVSAGKNGEGVWIQVKDTGPGIPVEEQEKIFTPFYRGKRGRRFPQGMGLGLTIARDLVEAHQGRLEIESTPGSGSCFTIYLPVL